MRNQPGWILWGLLVLCPLVGCGNDNNSAAPQEEQDSTAEIDAQQVNEDLRAIPYSESVENDSERQSGVVKFNRQKSSPGYNLFSLHSLSMAELIDPRGTAVHRWALDDTRHWAHVELLEDGRLLLTGTMQTEFKYVPDESRFIAMLDWHGKVLWRHLNNAHHDAEVTPSGQILTLTFRRRPLPELHPTVPVRDDQLSLLDAEGNLLESASLYDMARAAPEVFPLRKTVVSKVFGPPLVDLFHCNSVEWMWREELFATNPLYGPNNILVCSRHQDRVFVVDWQQKKIVWAWGENDISGPHDAQVLASGNILIFDNGLNRKDPAFSRVLELDPFSGEIVWQYQADPPERFFTASRGSAQKLPNDNLLIASSAQGTAFEVTPSGKTVWRFVNPHRVAAGGRATIIRMRRYDTTFVRNLLDRYRED